MREQDLLMVMKHGAETTMDGKQASIEKEGGLMSAEEELRLLRRTRSTLFTCHLTKRTSSRIPKRLEITILMTTAVMRCLMKLRALSLQEMFNIQVFVPSQLMDELSVFLWDPTQVLHLQAERGLRWKGLVPANSRDPFLTRQGS